MKENINNEERMNESARIFRLNSVSEFFEASIKEAKVFE